jgi:hypothetical protein
MGTKAVPNASKTELRPDGLERFAPTRVAKSGGWSPEYCAVIDELAVLLRRRRSQSKFCERILRLLSEEFHEFVVITLHKAPAGVPKDRYCLEPSDRLLYLLAAVRTNDSDAISILEHELRS